MIQPGAGDLKSSGETASPKEVFYTCQNRNASRATKRNDKMILCLVPLENSNNNCKHVTHEEIA